MRGNSLEGLVSVESPIGKALMGHKAGDKVYVQVNTEYGYYLTIRSIENTEDSDSDKIRKDFLKINNFYNIWTDGKTYHNIFTNTVNTMNKISDKDGA